MYKPILCTLFVACLEGAQPPAVQPSPAPAPANACGPIGTIHMRSTLYFGLAHRGGSVSKSQWSAFVRAHVTPNFPNGFTVWEAGGQWRQSDGRIVRERSRVLLLLHEDSPAVRSALSTLVTEYKRAFRQESVLWETAPVCAMF